MSSEIKAFTPFSLLDYDIKVRGDAGEMYIKKTYGMGWAKWVQKYYPGNYGAPGVPRLPKKKATPMDIARQNERNRIRKVQLLIMANFREGDWHLVLKYKPDARPADPDEAKAIIKKFLDNMRNAYKKAGYQFKYIYVTEKGKRGAYHHHLIIQDIAEPGLNTKKMVMKFWPHGNRAFIPLYEDGEFENLSAYIVKKETKEESRGCSYSRSRNLALPRVEKEPVYSKRWRREPKPEKGWYIVPDSVVNGINPVTGYPYQHYMMVKIPEGSGKACRRQYTST